MKHAFRVVLVLGFLVSIGPATPAASTFMGCNEYDCSVYVDPSNPNSLICIPEHDVYCPDPFGNGDLPCYTCWCNDAGDCYFT